MNNLQSTLQAEDIEALKSYQLKRLSCDWSIKKLLPQDFTVKVERRLSAISTLEFDQNRRISEAYEQHYI
eukprot:TRINITY_DN2486_c0_g1_i1.p2 TRINITY_DN2486_c0_g1~~TRINITY_DN2486_c0_g1_i1.p2  ORF type:complete len:70 (+),score=15.40 TRINITY_DN2486_c0_g1_i1:710-919(+)